jgi:endonuclease/exonuclease/phosphatase family metal-dependent hydrolase
MAFAEMTEESASELRGRLFPGYHIHSLDVLPRSELHVAILYREESGFENAAQLVAPGVPRGTRPMASIDFVHADHRIRFFACHWAARFRQESEHTRSDVARFLNGAIYNFLHEPSEEIRHAIVLGDLNDEPFAAPVEQRLHARRSREFSLRPEHYSDRDVQRTRLYNCAWRYIGEQHPHSGPDTPASICGTYYWAPERKWVTLDHVIVTGSLLTDGEPFLDEASVRVLSPAMLLDEKSRPQKFSWNNGRPTGLSDHLPVFGSVTLRKGGNHA